MIAEQDPETLDVAAVEQSNCGRDNPGCITPPNFISTSLSNSCSAGTSDSEGTIIKTDSQLSMTGFDGMDVHKYVPSEELTRTILVPPPGHCVSN